MGDAGRIQRIKDYADDLEQEVARLKYAKQDLIGFHWEVISPTLQEFTDRTMNGELIAPYRFAELAARIEHKLGLTEPMEDTE
jgi:hypothetical protein